MKLNLVVLSVAPRRYRHRKVAADDERIEEDADDDKDGNEDVHVFVSREVAHPLHLGQGKGGGGEVLGAGAGRARRSRSISRSGGSGP